MRYIGLLIIAIGVVLTVMFVKPYVFDSSINPHRAVVQYRYDVGHHIMSSTKAVIDIPSWHQSFPIEDSVSENTLNEGVVGHFPRTGPVGVGNYALAAHVVTHGQPFAKLPGVVKGQRVIIEKNNRRYVFVVDNKFTIYYTDTSVLNYHPRELTLITCASRYFHTNYRTVVTAHLIKE